MMNDLLSFLNSHIRHNSMNVDEFCRQVGISRQKFYRYAKEPRKFTRQNIQSMIDVLSLEEEDRARLELFLDSGSQKKASLETSAIDEILSRLLKWQPACESEVSANCIELIHADTTVTIESPASIVFQQAGNRLHTIKAVLVSSLA